MFLSIEVIHVLEIGDVETKVPQRNILGLVWVVCDCQECYFVSYLSLQFQWLLHGGANLDREDNWLVRSMKETIYVKLKQPSLNRGGGF